MSGFVYAIRSGCGLVKIGWSSDPQKRFGKVQSDAPQPCVLVGAIPETREYEAALHAKFSAFRERGEWFREEGDVAAFVTSLPKHRSRRAQAPAGAHPLLDYVRRTGTTLHQIARDAGCSRMTLYRMMRGEQNATIGLIQRVSAATGGAVTAEDFFPAPQPAQGEQGVA